MVARETENSDITIGEMLLLAAIGSAACQTLYPPWTFQEQERGAGLTFPPLAPLSKTVVSLAGQGGCSNQRDEEKAVHT